MSAKFDWSKLSLEEQWSALKVAPKLAGPWIRMNLGGATPTWKRFSVSGKSLATVEELGNGGWRWEANGLSDTVVSDGASVPGASGRAIKMACEEADMALSMGGYALMPTAARRK